MINEISVKISPQLLISKITTSFDKSHDPFSMNSRIELVKFEPEPTFENTTNDIKDDYMKNIASAVMNLSAIPLFSNSFEQISFSIIIGVETF